MTMFSEVPHPNACAVTANAGDRGIEAGGSATNATGRNVACVTELPLELQKVANGERLRGGFIIKTVSPPAFPVFLIARGFPLDRPDLVCRMLTERMQSRMGDVDATMTCLFPAEIADVQVNGSDSPKP